MRPWGSGRFFGSLERGFGGKTFAGGWADVSSSSSFSSSLSPLSSRAAMGQCRWYGRLEGGDVGGRPHVVARLVAALFFASAAYQVFPLVPSALVEHTIKLMRTDQAFLQDAGMTRLQWLCHFEPARRRARELGAVEAVEALDGMRSGRDDAWETRRRALREVLDGGGDEGSREGL